MDLTVTKLATVLAVVELGGLWRDEGAQLSCPGTPQARYGYPVPRILGAPYHIGSASVQKTHVGRTLKCKSVKIS